MCKPNSPIPSRVSGILKHFKIMTTKDNIMKNWKKITINILFICTTTISSNDIMQARANSQTSDIDSLIPTTCADFISSHDGSDQHKKNIADTYLGMLIVKGIFVAKSEREKDQNLMRTDENTPTIVRLETINICRGEPEYILSNVVSNQIENHIRGPYYR